MTTTKSPASNYINRDLSWIEFNWRVLQEAQDGTTPLLERVKFLSIVSTNLDEFMSVRVAGLYDQLKANYAKKDFTGYLPEGLLKRVMKRTFRMVSEQYKTYREILRLLQREGIVITEYENLNISQRKIMEQYFHEIVYPVLTPMAVDQSRPFPLVHTQSLYLAVVLHKEGMETENEPYFAIVQVPSNLSRFIPLTARGNSKKHEFILLEDLIREHIQTLFAGYVPMSVHSFRLTRNADLTLNEEGAEDLLEEIEKELRRRRWGAPVRLEVQKGIHPYALDMLREEFEIEDNVFEIDGPIDLSFLMKLQGSLEGYSSLRYKPLDPVYPRELDEDDLFEVLRRRDVLVHHPYESFEAVTDFVFQAAEDPKVLAIKMTLYRVSGQSRLVQALATAAELGKQVTVVVELKARFDEERNIAWARKLEKAGCHVVYGLIGLKTHAKITLVVRQENSNLLRRYVHVGTGNYNDNTARLYTDVGLFTTHPMIGEDASILFNEITGYSTPKHMQALSVAPTNLMSELFELFRREGEHAKAGRPARIIAKMNSLSHQDTIDELYKASQAGVKLDLIIRGVCCLRPGVAGLSDNISVISIVDRFLEHSRIIYFENGGEPEIYISSADWMSRNLTRRVELLCPVLDNHLKRDLIRVLQLSLNDNVKARVLQPNGMYETRQPGDEPPLRSQFTAMNIRQWKQEGEREPEA